MIAAPASGLFVGRRVSAASVKGTSGRAFSDRPRTGTALRGVYDAFMLQPASPVEVKSFPAPYDRSPGRCLEDLRNYYGLDIHYHSRGAYWLVGLTDANGVYHDFIAHRVPEGLSA